MTTRGQTAIAKTTMVLTRRTRARAIIDQRNASTDTDTAIEIAREDTVTLDGVAMVTVVEDPVWSAASVQLWFGRINLSSVAQLTSRALVPLTDRRGCWMCVLESGGANEPKSFRLISSLGYESREPIESSITRGLQSVVLFVRSEKQKVGSAQPTSSNLSNTHSKCLLLPKPKSPPSSLSSVRSFLDFVRRSLATGESSKMELTSVSPALP